MNSSSGRATPRSESGNVTPRPSNKQSSSSAILVGVRVRPFNQREIKFGSKCIVGMEGASNVRLTQVSQGKVIPTAPPKVFSFDHAFWTHSRDPLQTPVDDGTPLLSARGGDASSSLRRPCKPAGFADQSVVYEAVGKQILRNVLEGYNSCLFAYGQTGSGKTYTMMGTATDPGVMPRIAKELFDTIEQLSGTTKFTVEASFCEIYNEKVRDLMNNSSEPPPELQIRKHNTTGIFVQGLRKFAIVNAASFSTLLETGLASRATGSTLMNSTSSRSHAIVMLTITQATETSQLFGRLSLVDLAGSERVDATGATGATAQEGQKINLSLTTLGMCLSRLAEQAQGKIGLHIPYRDSSLTFLLSESLGGNSKTAMLANISPASVNFEETLSTLRFASIVKTVCNVAVVNENPEKKLVQDLKQELAELQKRLRELQQQQQQPRPSMTTVSDIESQIELDQIALDSTTKVAEQLPSTGSGVVVRAMETPVDDLPLLARGKTFTEILVSSPTEALACRHYDCNAGTSTVPEVMDVRARSMSTARDVFVDWNTPQLINLRPDDTSEMPLAVSLVEGTNHIKLQGVDVFFEYDGLMSRVTLFGSTGKIFLNGAVVEDVGTILRHRDRVVVGSLAMWFAHSSTLALCDYNTIPSSEEHIVLLEKHDRWMIVEERSKDAMSIGRAFFRLIPTYQSSLDADEPSALAGEQQRQGSGLGSTPRSSNPLLAAIGDDIAMSNEAVYKFEVQLADEYPMPRKIPGVLSGDEALDTLLEDDQNTALTYDGAIREQQTGNAEQLELLSQLKEKLHAGGALMGSGGLEGSCSSFRRRCGSRGTSSFRGTTASPDRGHSSRSLMNDFDHDQPKSAADASPDDLAATGSARGLGDSVVAGDEYHQDDDIDSSDDEEVPYSEEDQISQDAISEMTSRQDVQAQIAYHSRVRQLQNFSRFGPRDEEDKKFWSKLQSDPPFLGDPALMLEQQVNAFVIDFSSTTAAASASNNTVVAPATGVMPIPASGSNWAPRFICASAKFIFLFKKQDPKERSVSALYIPGAMASVISSPARDRGNMLFVVNVFPSCGRHPKDTSVNGNFAGISLGFRSQQEAAAWGHFITAKAAPPLPMTLLKRRIAVEVGDSIVTPEEAAGAPVDNSSAVFTPFGAAARKASTLFFTSSAPSKYKSADKVKNCEEPSCGKSLWFFQKKHCEGCSLIFCPSCMDPVAKSKCKTCSRSGASNMSFAFVNNVSKKQHFRLDYRSLPHGHRLVHDFFVRLSHADHVSEEIVFRCDHFVGRIHTCPADAIAGAERHEIDPQRLRLSLRDGSSKVMLFRSAYEREQCLESIFILIGSRVFLSGLACITDESDIILSAPFEQQVPAATDDDGGGGGGGVTSPLSNGSTSSPSDCALLRASSKGKTNWAVWVGVEADRPIPFFKPKLAMFAVLGTQESWSEATARSCGLYIAASVPLGPAMPTLFVLVRDIYRLNVPSVHSFPVVRVPAATKGGAAAFLSGAISIRVLETTILVVGLQPVDQVGAPVAINEQGGANADPSMAMNFTNGLFSSLRSCGTSPSQSTSNRSQQQMTQHHADLSLAFDYTIVINAPPISDFDRFSGTVQVRSSMASTGATGVEAKRGVTCAELILPVIRIHVSKFSVKPRGRPLVLLRKVVFYSLTRGDENENKDLTQQAELWANVAFDRLDQTTGKVKKADVVRSVSTSATSAGTIGDGASSLAATSASSEQQYPAQEERGGSPMPKKPLQIQPRFESDDSHLLRSVLLANAMPEYYMLRKVLVVVPGVGTAAVPFSACGNGEMTTAVDVFRNGVRVGTFEITLSNQCATSWRQKS